MAKTKTTTRSKPATSKKTETAGSAAPDGAADIRMIPLDQLEPSQLNVRKVAASASDDAELLASIRETGIKQNLVVHALSETRFAVDAGGRRLKALKQLAEDSVIPADHPVPCLVDDKRNAILTSATENLQRAAMHPADQFEAFEAMIAEGRSEDEIALKFGVSVDLVRRRQRNDVAGRPRAVTLDDWKLIWTPFLPAEEAYELYDLTGDPGETRDLYSPEHPRAGPLHEALEAWLARAPLDEPVPTVSESDREALRQLGYVE